MPHVLTKELWFSVGGTRPAQAFAIRFACLNEHGAVVKAAAPFPHKET